MHCHWYLRTFSTKRSVNCKHVGWPDNAIKERTFQEQKFRTEKHRLVGKTSLWGWRRRRQTQTTPNWHWRRHRPHQTDTEEDTDHTKLTLKKTQSVVAVPTPNWHWLWKCKEEADSLKVITVNAPPPLPSLFCSATASGQPPYRLNFLKFSSQDNANKQHPFLQNFKRLAKGKGREKGNGAWAFGKNGKNDPSWNANLEASANKADALPVELSPLLSLST